MDVLLAPGEGQALQPTTKKDSKINQRERAANRFIGFSEAFRKAVKAKTSQENKVRTTLVELVNFSASTFITFYTKIVTVQLHTRQKIKNRISSKKTTKIGCVNYLPNYNTTTDILSHPLLHSLAFATHLLLYCSIGKVA